VLKTLPNAPRTGRGLPIELLEGDLTRQRLRSLIGIVEFLDQSL
jgi:hypothetical protein